MSALLLASCGQATPTAQPSAPSPAPPTVTTTGPGGVLGTRSMRLSLAEDMRMRVDLLGLDRVAPGVVVARWRLGNESDRELYFWPWMAEALGTGSDGNAISGASLLDGHHSRQYLPLHDQGGYCLCTREIPTFVKVDPQGTYELAAAFPAPPADVTQVDVLLPPAPPFLDVPIGDRPGEPIRVAPDETPIDLAATPTSPPRVLDVVAATQDAAKTEAEDAETLSVRLSADVLFALNKADLTPRAQAVLGEVAAKLDQSPGQVVKIDGHADSTGDDAINRPLSERRADSVRTALEQLVTREGLSYQVAGHGSDQPIASNDTEEGRRLNRRVTVSFARPPRPAPPARAAPPPTPSGAEPTVIATATATELPDSVPLPPGEVWPQRAEVQVNELRRDRDGNVLLVWTVRNDEADQLRADVAFSDSSGLYEGSSTTGVTLGSGDRRFLALRNAEGYALGPGLNTGFGNEYYKPAGGTSVTLHALYRVPPEVTSVDVDLPGFTRIADLQIT